MTLPDLTLDQVIAQLRSRLEPTNRNKKKHNSNYRVSSDDAVNRHLRKLMALKESNLDAETLGPVLAAFNPSNKKLPGFEIYDHLEDGSTKHSSSASTATSLLGAETSPMLVHELRECHNAIDLSMYPRSMQEELRSNEIIMRVAHKIQAGFDALEVAATQLPGKEIRDLWTKVPYVPPTPLPPGYELPAAFPRVPLAVRGDPYHMKALNLDTLMFIFYFRTDARSQYMAARELKQRHWRFHTKHRTWFHRHAPPDLCNDTFEQGDFVYFDHEYDWCTRVKSDFVFEYIYLEDEVPLE